MMKRFFNTAGPCNQKRHYMIDATTRLQGVEQLIDMEQYFVIYATGMLTAIRFPLFIP